MSPTFWGPHFPDQEGQTFWGPHFPDGAQDPAYFSGYGHPGSATFALDLESDFTVRHTWVTDIIKRYSGTEQRIAVNDAPKQTYDGTCVLQNSDPRKIRGYLARYIAAGSQFLLGLPYEELTLVADASGTTVYVNNTALLLCDWAKIGQRVIVMDPDGVSTNAVIQSAGDAPGEITLDISPGDLGRQYSRIMPGVPVFLDAKQGFIRHPLNAEQWKINARAALFDFAPTLARLALGPITASASLENVYFVSRVFGLRGNTIMVNFYEDSSYPAGGSFVESEYEVQILYQGGATTIGDIAALLETSSYIKLTGSYTPSDILPAGIGDRIDNVYLTGGEASGSIGTGATLTEYADRPVWDAPIQVDGTGTDSLQALTELIDMDGVPYVIGSADYPDWGRHMMLRSGSRAVWQWFKLFVATVRGRQRAFWLPSWRHDFTFISKDTNSIVVSTEDDSDFLAWWPAQRDQLQVIEADGTVTYTQITDAVDNGDGTATFTIDTTLASSEVLMISWLELCRFENDDFTISWKSHVFTYTDTARVVRA